MSKDPEDFHLDHLDFKKMKVGKRVIARGASRMMAI
jgi:hypothetical protein